ncbi:MAG: hypothetical protein Q9160_003820 [Pyrenula sp. 1 TL-2023]
MVHPTTPRSSPPSKGLFAADALPGYPSSSNDNASRRSLTHQSLRTGSQRSDEARRTSPSVENRAEERSPTPDFVTYDRQVEIALSSDKENAGASESAPDTPRNVRKENQSRPSKPKQSALKPSPAKRQLRERDGTFRPYTKDRNDRRRQGQGRRPLTQEHMGGVKSSKAAKPASTKREEGDNDVNIITPQSSSNIHASRPVTSGENCLGQDDMSRAEKISRTTLYIELDGSKYPAVPVYLGSCNTVEAFIDTVQYSWDLSSEEIEAVTVGFPWRDDRCSITVKKAIPDTFQKTQDEIFEAPCWTSDRRCRCEVEVMVYKKRSKC